MPLHCMTLHYTYITFHHHHHYLPRPRATARVCGVWTIATLGAGHIAVHCIALRCIALHYITTHLMTLHYTSYYITFTWHDMTLRYQARGTTCTSLHRIVLHYMPLHRDTRRGAQRARGRPPGRARGGRALARPAPRAFVLATVEQARSKQGRLLPTSALVARPGTCKHPNAHRTPNYYIVRTGGRGLRGGLCMFSFEVNPPLPPPANGPPRRRGDFSVMALLPRYLHTRSWVFAFPQNARNRRVRLMSGVG